MPPETNKVEMLEKRLNELEGEFRKILFSDRYYFERDLEISNGRNFIFSQGTGSKLGSSSSEKLSLWGVTPVDQPETVSDPSGQVNDLDSEARTAIVSIIDRLQESGNIK